MKLLQSSHQRRPGPPRPFSLRRELQTLRRRGHHLTAAPTVTPNGNNPPADPWEVFHSHLDKLFHSRIDIVVVGLILSSQRHLSGNEGFPIQLAQWAPKYQFLSLNLI